MAGHIDSCYKAFTTGDGNEAIHIKMVSELKVIER